jgi:arsenate reductase
VTREAVIYHNPACSKSRAALEILESHGLTPRVVRYLESPPDADTLRDLLHRLGIDARDLIRTHEAPYAELGLGDADDEETLIVAMTRHPVLIERPVVVVDGKAVIGRPPERVLEIL